MLLWLLRSGRLLCLAACYVGGVVGKHSVKRKTDRKSMLRWIRWPTGVKSKAANVQSSVRATAKGVRSHITLNQLFAFCHVLMFVSSKIYLEFYDFVSFMQCPQMKYLRQDANAMSASQICQ